VDCNRGGALRRGGRRCLRGRVGRAARPLLAGLGRRVTAPRVRKSVGRTVRDEKTGAWYRLAQAVMSPPLTFAAVIVIILLFLAFGSIL
jgi:uncharacterized membrane protein YdfJ with MMPL/SSD domain